MVDLILDKGLVIDVYVRVSLVGIELLTIDARIVVASVDTYLRFAEAVNRLDLAQGKEETLPELLQDMQEGGAKHKTKGALEGVKDTVSDVADRIRGRKDEDEDDEDEEEEEEEIDDEDEGQEEEDEEEPEEQPRRRRAPAARRRRER
ncbi:gas vesicle protein GvpJ [Catenulispora subtropica]|uniref:gas vesicle protein GvpJ n=1 Tax=Catenulispora subtropica TaxID=450798 RepID=UPI003CD073F2